jgi:DNA-binding response OmpR family regulator
VPVASRILLVEDNAMMAAVFKAALNGAGLEVRHVDRGRPAVDLASSWAPDIVLLDVGLPDLDGFTVCQAIRALDAGERPTIVMLTARQDLDSKLQGFAAGADDYLLKPIDPRELRTRILTLLESRVAQDVRIASRRFEAIRQIVATVCHEINNPLTSAIMAIDLELATRDPAVPADHLQTCHAELLRIATVLERLKAAQDRVTSYLRDDTMIDLDQR